MFSVPVKDMNNVSVVHSDDQLFVLWASDKTIKIYDGFYHEVFNEPEHDQVLRDVETWLEAHLGYWS